MCGDFFMQTYQIFEIKEDIYYIYKTEAYKLYKILHNLYYMNKVDISYALTLYNQVCNRISINKLKQEINILKTKQHKNKYIINYKQNKIIIIIKPTRIIIKANHINPILMYLLNEYNKYLFVCNFETQQYFWINNNKTWTKLKNLVK